MFKDIKDIQIYTFAVFKIIKFYLLIPELILSLIQILDSNMGNPLAVEYSGKEDTSHMKFLNH